MGASDENGYAQSDSVRDLLKDTEETPIFIQGPGELAGVLLSVETYELMGRYDDGMLEERDGDENDARGLSPPTARFVPDS